MSASRSFLLGSTEKWNSKPLKCRQSMTAFLSKPLFAYPHGSFSGRLSSGRNSSSQRIRSKLSGMHCFRGFRKTRSLHGLISFQLGKSRLLQTFPNHGRRSLAARSAGDSVQIETQWTSLVKACISQGSEVSKLMVLSDAFTDLASNELVHFVSLLTTVLGVSGIFYAYSSKENGDLRQNLSESERITDIGQYEHSEGWQNLSKATPFNRFVTARCPSLARPMGGSNRKDAETEFKMESKRPEYQRLCLQTEDGGTVALDFPSHLDFVKNKELENMLLIIPGSTEGSEDKGIGRFGRVAEERGYFPVVLNPRGCGGSPLTTPRVFSAADSDDVRVAVQYIAKRRPWATIMAVGWGFGANMLSKYLGEEAYGTPLTAAVCVDNPYNLDKVTQSVTASHWNDLDQALTKGLVNILDANKKLFLGKSKGFDVIGGLAATSLSEFETAISRVAHGYDSLHRFYEGVSSEAILERVQIPLLCIQHVEDYKGHQISLSQSAFDKNPYIMLLVSPASVELLESSDFPGVASEWSHDIAFEWLAAVEVALLKGRHPLLNVVEFTVKPSKEWSPLGSQITSTATAKKVSEPGTTTILDASRTYDTVDDEIIDVTGDISDLSEHSTLGPQELSMRSSVEASEQNVHRNDAMSRYDRSKIIEGSDDATKKHTDDAIEEHSQEEKRRVESETSRGVIEDQDSGEDVERGQVQLAAESVMKILDVTMPGTLSAEKKQQVLEAVGRGETLVGALQEAVPEDVRGKMASAVSAAVQAKGISLKTAGFGEKIPAPKLSPGLTESLKEKLAGLTGNPGDSSPDNDLHSVSEKKSSNDVKNENAAHSESTVHGSERSTEKNSPGKASTDGGKGNADMSKDRVAQNEDIPHDTSEDHTDRSGTTGYDDSKVSDDMKNVTSVAQVEQPSVAGSDVSQVTSTDGSKSADDLNDDASVPRIEQASHERQTQETKDNLDVQKTHDSGKSEGKADQKDTSIGTTNGQVDSHARESNAAPEPKIKGDEGTNDRADEVKGDTPKASGKEGDQKKEPGVTESMETSERKDEPNKQEPTPSGQIDNYGQSSETSDSKTEAKSDLPEEAGQKSQNDGSGVGSPVPAPVPPQPLAHDQVTPVPSVGQALQALTGFDDATQMAVTNVFSVVENVLDQLEKGNPNLDNGSTAAEKGEHEEENKRRTCTIGNAHETGGSVSEDDPGKVVHDVNDSESDEEHGKEMGSGSLSVVEVKRVTTNGSQEGSQIESGGRKFQDGNRGSVEQSVRRQEDQGREEVVNGQFEDHCPQQEVGNGSIRPNNDTAAIRLFAEQGKQKLVKKLDSRLVDMRSTRNECAESGSEYPQHQKRSASPVDTRRLQAQTSDGISDMPRSLAYPDDGKEQRLAAIAAEIDEDNEKRLSEKDNTRNDDGNDTNSDGEDQDVIRDVVMNALKLEVLRRIGGAGLDSLGLDLEKEMTKVAHAVSEAVRKGEEKILDFALERDGEIEGGEGGEEAASSRSDSGRKLGILNGNTIVGTVGTVLDTCGALGRLIPLGVLVGVVLAALGALFLIVTDDQDEEKNGQEISTSSSKSGKRYSFSSETGEFVSENHAGPVSNSWSDNKHGGSFSPSDKISSEKNNAVSEDDSGNLDAESDVYDSVKDEGPNHGKLVGAVTAAMGATAAVASQSEASTASRSEKVNSSDRRETDGVQGVHDSGDGDGLPKFVPEIAEKAISMVSPVVPKKEDGEVDQDRLVAMLAEIGQKGGILTLVGKAALLWGGLRGAMSLADRLIGFLRIRDRPLQQRLLGFVGMAILLWTPVLVPLLPTLLQRWATKSPSGVADAAAGVGLYGAVFILVTIWGKRVRGYDRPLVAYGLELLSRAKLRFVALGMAIGVNLVTAYYGITWALGFISFSWGSVLVENPSFPGPGPTAVLTIWRLLSLIAQSVSMAFIVALVEELLFRAWLLEEIAVDLGYHWAILLSAIAFAIVHWSPPAMVGLWFLSVALAGARSRMDGDLGLSIGIHAGVVAAFSVVNLGNLIYYLPTAPAWFTGTYAGNPLAGALGVAMVAALAIILYPRKQELPPAEDDEYDYGDDS